MARPFVVVHVAVALDGATTGFPVDVERFYALAATWHEDVTLTGADTILAQEAVLRASPGPGPAAGGPLLAVVDGRARVSAWRELRDAGYWSAVLALRCRATPPREDGGWRPEELVVGEDRVDLRAALEALGRRAGTKVVRVDSGGGLTGALLAEGLVDEVSLLVHPAWSGASGRAWHGQAVAPAAELRLAAAERLGDLVWLRYRFGGAASRDGATGER
ncbi:2,5-diamino-6-(ribosylamino)-4(3H)-pyrimidinone 5'-phosphate reductase [Georgenia soli]|uniref:2,5-diamino-6-(Ribosylamino)-4(3H)-pyrimidinone 5'-phosphate reductase n=1 Tax=Georgenia soli TaxID=638953 RepID=A0A2A9EGZ0_9MICO|nr:dihydrofolate reductase family protein [Georgenia soli]PFG38113.1 2,5-diamino-6-(ribosylamino)-4(3H)-pyrimidinone 5'-phosphate reductase [Georgenia soli]